MLVSSVRLSLTIIPGRGRSAIAQSSSRAPRSPELEVSGMRAAGFKPGNAGYQKPFCSGPATPQRLRKPQKSAIVRLANRRRGSREIQAEIQADFAEVSAGEESRRQLRFESDGVSLPLLFRKARTLHHPSFFSEESSSNSTASCAQKIRTSLRWSRDSRRSFA
jgi:hypothetical protein